MRRRATHEASTISSNMADSFHSLNYHLIWSTKDRYPWLTGDIESHVWEYLAGIAREKGMTAISVGGYRDHVHLLVRVPPTIDLSKAVQLLKGPSSKWMRETFPGFSTFHWQDGYGAFTVSKSGIKGVGEYIRNQAEHHRVKTFQEEFVEFLKRQEMTTNQSICGGRRSIRVSLCDT